MAWALLTTEGTDTMMVASGPTLFTRLCVGAWRTPQAGISRATTLMKWMMSTQHTCKTAMVGAAVPSPRFARLQHCSSAVSFHILVFVVAVVIVISRRPDVVWNAQFWAEDGARWYAEAYQYGIHSVLVPSTGYFVILQRLTGLAAQSVPMSRGPLLFNLIGLVVQVLPISLFLSSRFAFAGSLNRRILFSFVYLALPNTAEVDVNITNAQWHLALLGCMVLLAGNARSRWWMAFDLAVVALLALTGPFTILLVPVAVLIFWQTRERWLALLGGVVVAGALLEAVTFLESTRSGRVLGASWHQFIRITAHQVFWAPLFGSSGFWLPDPQPRWYFALLALTVLLGFSLLLFALWKGPFRLKLFLSFGMELFAAALVSPLGEWRVLHLPGAAGRYWFFPMLCFLACLFWLALAEGVSKKLRWVALALLLSMVIGVARNWRYPPLVDFHFARYAREFDAVPKNTRFEIPINPPGWKMVLLKK